MSIPPTLDGKKVNNIGLDLSGKPRSVDPVVAIDNLLLAALVLMSTPSGLSAP